MVDRKRVYKEIINITEYILNSVSDNGSWATIDYTDWGPVITALNIGHLLNCGMTVEDEWEVTNGTEVRKCSIKKCLKFLANNVHHDGSFGADFWDTCQLAIIIVRHNLQDYFDYIKIHSYILQYVQEQRLQVNPHDYGQSVEWSGPGTYSACAVYLFYAGEVDLSKLVLSEAIHLQQSDGSFVGKKTRTGDNVIHPIWHTSQILTAIVKTGFICNPEVTNRIGNWIISVQGDNGEYDDFGQFVTYYTAYAALAFIAMQPHPQPYTDKSINYLIQKVNCGKVDDFGGTIMVAQVFDSYLSDEEISSVYQSIQIKTIERLLSKQKKYESELSELNQKLVEYEEKYKDADIVLSKKDAWKIGIWFGVVTLILGLIVPVIINIAGTFILKSYDNGRFQSDDSYYIQNIEENNSIGGD